MVQMAFIPDIALSIGQIYKGAIINGKYVNVGEVYNETSVYGVNRRQNGSEYKNRIGE